MLFAVIVTVLNNAEKILITFRDTLVCTKDKVIVLVPLEVTSLIVGP